MTVQDDPAKRTQWGVWRLDTSNWTLAHTGPEGRGYEVDLEDMATSGQMLDWIVQVSGKPWATRQDVGELVQALDDIFHPGQTLCSGGGSTQIDPLEYLTERR